MPTDNLVGRFFDQRPLPDVLPMQLSGQWMLTDLKDGMTVQPVQLMI